MGELLEHDLIEDAENQSEAFKVTDDYKADWALRKYRSYQERIELNASLADKERKRIEDWLTSENEKLQQKQSFFENHLIAYAIGERDKNDRKTISLPNGTISTRQGSDAPTIEDKESVIGWLKENNHVDVIKVKEELDLTEFKKQIVIDGEKVIWKDTGEIVQGVSVKNGKLSLKIVI